MENRQVSVIYDVLRGTPHAIAVSDDSGIKIKALTEYGSSLVSDINSISDYSEKVLPAGFSATKFSTVDENTFDTLSNIKFDDDVSRIAARRLEAPQRKFKFEERNNFGEKSNAFRSPSGRALNKFQDVREKLSILEFKAKLFKIISDNSGEYSKIKNNKNIGIDKKTGQLIATDKEKLANIAIGGILGSIRQKNIVRNITSFEIPTSSNRRAERRAELLSVAEKISSDSLTGNQRVIMTIRQKLRNKI